MDAPNAAPKEGDLYKTLRVGGHTIELRYGFYAEFEREIGEPVVIYPDLSQKKLYTKDGRMLATAIQEPCAYYQVPEGKTREECCCDCEYYLYSGDDIGICACPSNRKEKREGRPRETEDAPSSLEACKQHRYL